MEDLKRAALYVRVSSEDQYRHGLSLDEQKISLTRYAEQHDMKIVGIYEDAGISARKSYKKRPALLRLLDDCKHDKVDTILFIKLDRWFRDVGSYYEVQAVLDRYKVTWQATLEDYETVTASGRLKVNIMLSVAQDEADRTSERTKFILDGKKQRLEALGGKPPTGYKAQDKRYVIDEEKERGIRAMLETYLTSGNICKAQDAAAANGVKLEYHTIVRLLSNAAYKGVYHGIDGMTPPYISAEDWDKIQSMRRKQSRRTPRRDYIFSGLCVCAECGKRMVGKTMSGYQYYNCRFHAERRCSNKVNMRQDAIESYLMQTFDDELNKHSAKIIRKEKHKTNPAEITKLKTRLSRLKALYLDGIIELAEYKEDKLAIERRIEELTPKENKKQTDLTTVFTKEWKEIYNSLSDEARRVVWLSAIKEIVIFPDRHIEYVLID